MKIYCSKNILSLVSSASQGVSNLFFTPGNRAHVFPRQVSVLMLLFLGSLSCGAEAANWYVRASGGSGAGTSWTAAWNGMSAISWGSVACGDTIWIAGGSYSNNLSPNKVCTVGAQIFVRRARSDDAGATGAAGWNSSFDSDIVGVDKLHGIQFTNSAAYITFSGRTTAAGGTQGWIINDTGAGDRPINVSAGLTVNHVTFEYLNVNGGLFVPSVDGGGNDSRAFGMTASSVNFATISHVNIRGFCAGVYISGNNFLFEYGSIYDVNPSDSSVSGCHADPIFPIGGNNGIIRYVWFHDNTGEGIYFPSFSQSSNDGWQIYGNVFTRLNISYSKAIEVEIAVTNFKVFNNTFYSNWADLRIIGGSGSCGAGSEVRNNLVYSSSGLDSCGTMSNNIVNTASNPFVNATPAQDSGGDFHIVSTIGANFPKDKGIALGAPFNVDRDGNIRGSDGTWDIGAFEFNSGVISNLQPPTNLRVL